MDRLGFAGPLVHREELLRQVGMYVCACVCLCLSVRLSHGGAFPWRLLPEQRPSDWEGRAFLQVDVDQVYLECRLLGQRAVAQDVEGHSTFQMNLVTASSRKPSVLPCPPVAPFLFSSTHAVSLGDDDPQAFCPPAPQELAQCQVLYKHMEAFAELSYGKRSISSISKQREASVGLGGMSLWGAFSRNPVPVTNVVVLTLVLGALHHSWRLRARLGVTQAWIWVPTLPPTSLLSRPVT